MSALAHLRQRWSERVDGASLAALRVLFGSLMFAATVRFAAYGWIHELYVAPRFYFHYFGFEWVRPWPPPLLYVHFALLAGAALLVALGLFYRVAISAFTLLFLYVELLDVTNYLNHYYAITLVGLLLCCMPAANTFSLDALRARRRGTALDPSVPRGSVELLRLQLGIIYFFAGVAKLQPDWLLRAEPLSTWLAARTDAPVIGRLLGLPYAPQLMSWTGALFDLTVPFFLSFKQTRRYAYGAVLLFHVATWEIFQIGMFPWIMLGLTPIFFNPDWPRRLWRRAPLLDFAKPCAGRPLSAYVFVAMLLWIALQVLMPLRHHLYPGNVLDTEQGFRWSWQVMIVQRSGNASFRVVASDGTTERVSPSDELTPLQVRMMATQPDLVLAYAHHLRDTYAARGKSVRVYADVFVATNGRPSRRLIDPDVDLAAQPDTIWGYPWLLTAPAPERPGPER